MLNSHDRAFDFASELKKTEKILVILPSRQEYTETMQNFVKKLSGLFKAARVSTFVSSSLRKEDLSWLGVPNEHYLKLIRDEQFDLVIDVNTMQDKICAYLCALSGAPMRLNLSAGQYDNIYNLHFRTSSEKTLDERLQHIVSSFILLLNQK